MSLKVYSVTRDLGFVRIFICILSELDADDFFHFKSDSRALSLELNTHLRLLMVVK